MENSVLKIANDLPAARMQYQKLLEYERKFDKLFRMLDRFLKEGKRGDLTDEYLTDQRKRAEKTRENMLADRKALEEKFEELQLDTTLQSEKNKSTEFEKNPLKLIPKQSPVKKISLTAKTTLFPVVTFRKVKLVKVAPMAMPKVLRIKNVTLLETQALQPFKPTPKRILSCRIHECFQTTSCENEKSYSLHVSSKTGASCVSLDLSLCKARSLDLACSFTTTRQRMMLTSTSNIQQPRALKEMLPLNRRSGTLLVMIQPFTTEWILPASSKPSSNCLSVMNMPQPSYLLSPLLLLQQLMRRLDLHCTFTTTRQRMMLTPTPSTMQTPHTLKQLMPFEQEPGALTVVIQSSATKCNSLSTSSSLPAFVRKDCSNCLLVSALLPLQQPMRRELLPIMDLSPVRALPQSSRFPTVFSTSFLEDASTTGINYDIKINRLKRETSLPIGTVPLQPRSRGANSLAILNHSEESSHELLDSNHSVEVTDVDEPLKASDIQDISGFKSDCNESKSRSKKRRSICKRIRALFTCCFRRQRQQRNV